MTMIIIMIIMIMITTSSNRNSNINHIHTGTNSCNTIIHIITVTMIVCAVHDDEVVGGAQDTL